MHGTVVSSVIFVVVDEKIERFCHPEVEYVTGFGSYMLSGAQQNALEIPLHRFCYVLTVTAVERSDIIWT
jgi:hypothetical protein